ncbi:hypothetical protein GCM10027341_19230 [Spirosoma knui]
MNTFFGLLIITLSLSSATAATPDMQGYTRTPHPTRLARYQMSAYLSTNNTKLNVNVDKQLGGQVYIHLNDRSGNVLFERILNPVETKIRLALDLTDLSDGDYLLTVSNGLDTIVREIKIATPKPVDKSRLITVESSM